MADVFDNCAPSTWRADLWELIRATPAVDWICLTKRPQNIAGMLPADWGEGWANVWPGTTTENQIEATRRIPHLVAIPAAVRFLSVEPMLETINLSPWLGELDWLIVGGESGVGNRSRRDALCHKGTRLQRRLPAAESLQQ
jgi:protein gp37